MPELRLNYCRKRSGFPFPGILLLRRCRGFTLTELLTAVAIIGMLFSIVVTYVLPAAMNSAKMAKSSSNLRQLGLATHLYLTEHDDRFFPYRQETEEGTLWYFGLERSGGPSGEGSRELDQTEAPIYPYIEQVGGIEICPGFDYNNALWKPKFRGASWGYGYNVLLGPIYRGDGVAIHTGKTLEDLSLPSRVLIFGTCAQVNTFQAPASPSNPMIEEFYLIDDVNRSIDFRFGNGTKALFVFADGHVEALPPYKGEMDLRLPSARIGRITPRGSREYLE
ncbi:MAG TPA: type II secretion system protein [Opitutales bacterium]|nr:type II secretion system protein [Opitutales bacterium]